MSLAEEASRSIQGAWGLLRRDPAAPQAFNATVEGFWRSFTAAFLLLPLSLAVEHVIGSSTRTEEIAPFSRWSIYISLYAIGWTLWPLLTLYITRTMGCGDRFLGYAVAYNWSQLITGPFQYGVTLFAFLAFDLEATQIAAEIALAAVLFYEYLVTRQMLQIVPARAVLLVLTSFLLNRMILVIAVVALRATGSEIAPG